MQKVSTTKKTQEEKLEEIMSVLKERYIDKGKKARSIKHLVLKNPDLNVQSLGRLIKSVHNVTQSEYLTSMGFVYDWYEYCDEQQKIRKRNFRTELPINELCKFYIEKYNNETVNNPYYKKIRSIEERDIVSGTVGEKDANNCYVHDGVLLSCKGIDIVNVTDGIEIIGPRAFLEPNGHWYKDVIEKINLPDSVRAVLCNGCISRDVKMNIPKGYLLSTDKLPEYETAELLRSVWKYEASILDWVSIYFTQDRTQYEEKCIDAFAVEPNATVAAFIAFLSAHPENNAIDTCIDWIINNRFSIAQEIIDEFYLFGKNINNTHIIEIFAPISTIESNGLNDANELTAYSAYFNTIKTDVFKKMRKKITEDSHYKGADENEIRLATMITTLYLDEWERCSRTTYGSMSEVNILSNGSLLRPIKICDKMFSLIDKDVYVDFLKSQVQGRNYRNFIIPFAYFASEKDINWYISAIKTAKKGKAQDRYRADSSEQTLYISNTRAAVAYFDKIDKLFKYAYMRGLDEDIIRIDHLYNFDFDESGKKIYDLGSRTVELKLNKDLTLYLYDVNAGKEVKSIPKKGSDPDKYEAAKIDFADKKSNIKKVAKSVCDKLFKLFLSGGSIQHKNWLSIYYLNPLLRNIAKLVVWSQGDSTFTVTDNGLITVDGLKYDLLEEDVKVAHPIEMTEDSIAAWQKYFVSNGLKQPFDQVWEPVIDFDKVYPDRYTGCEIPLFRFNKQEKHGIVFQSETEFDYYNNKYRYNMLNINLAGCSFDWKMTKGDIYDANMQSTITVTGFKYKSRTRATNHIIYYLDKCTVYGRIANDNDSVISDMSGYTVAQIDSFLKFAIEKGSTKCTAAFLNYKNEHFAEFADIDEFTLDF